MLATTNPTAPALPPVVLALPESPFAAQALRLLRQHGVAVRQVRPAGVERGEFCRLRRGVVVLQAESDGESGWLTCAKMCSAKPALRVVLVGHEPSDRERRLAEFVGATALVCETEGAHRLVAAILGRE